MKIADALVNETLWMVEVKAYVVVTAKTIEGARERAIEAVNENDGGFEIYADAAPVRSISRLPHGWTKEAIPYGSTEDDERSIGERFKEATQRATSSTPTHAHPRPHLGYDCAVCEAEARALGHIEPFERSFIVCQTCGNKRCPTASAHWLACSGSNEPGQAGSFYGPEAAWPKLEDRP